MPTTRKKKPEPKTDPQPAGVIVMERYKVKQPFKHGGTLYQRGDVFIPRPGDQRDMMIARRLCYIERIPHDN